MALRVVFMGTPQFSAATLAAVADAGHQIAAVYSQPPRPAGRRGLKMQPSAVAELAAARGFEVRTPVSLRSQEERARFRDLGADVAVVVAYGLILPKAILEGTRLGAYNGHASLLPRWRGAAPIQRAVMAGDEETGMMIMKMDEGLDTGPVALTRRVPIGSDTSAGELHDVLRDVGADLTVEALAKLEAGTLDLTPQPEAGAAYAAKISKAETRIDWSLPAGKVHDHIRGLSPAPGAWCEWTRDGRPDRLKVLKALPCAGEGAPGTVLDEELSVACGEGAIRLERVQPAGAKAMVAAEFLKGNRLAPGDRL